MKKVFDIFSFDASSFLFHLHNFYVMNNPFVAMKGNFSAHKGLFIYIIDDAVPVSRIEKQILGGHRQA
jgi:hypothetical protein